MNINRYYSIQSDVFAAGHKNEWEWAQKVERPDTPEEMLLETIWVICNSGMKYEVAQKIYNSVIEAIHDDRPIHDEFKHYRKVRAIEAAMDEANERYDKFMSTLSTQKILEYFESFDGIGPITKYHLARNLGINVCKPDRHLVRIAKKYDMTAFEMCSLLSKQSGERIGAVDVVLWRAAIMGII